MKNVFLLLLAFSLVGCESTSSGGGSSAEEVRLDGNKFEFGSRVERTIQFYGIGGTFQVGETAPEKGESIDFTRHQVVEEFDPEYEDGEKALTHYLIKDDYTSATWTKKVDPQETFATSPLRGYSLTGRKKGGAWSYSLDRTNVDEEMRKALSQVVYDQRATYPDGLVKVGDSWTRSPEFVNAFLSREVQDVSGSAVFALSGVERHKGERCAVIDVKIESSGDEILQDGSVTLARIKLKGQIFLSLESYLELDVNLSGEMVGSLVNNGLVRTYTTPIKLLSNEVFLTE
ncbi:hypothetical protein [Pelagicoccus mobilis]|uniref:Lipoprotein n=1 Tax=Pelagicoccus mobilis TaxID=415221 RepID=A0A934S0E4_9BACT|nr:hypothetical protein [Pelagicoccus mobilis]MBK1877602.1 hypothetical protein [Pelagicoccus mobilis]